MKQAERDAEQLRIILKYCRRIDEYVERFDVTKSIFAKDSAVQDSCAFCLVQIGEAVKRLSPEFKESHPHIEWNEIYGMRKLIVHAYDVFDTSTAWETIVDDIPPLREFCEERVVE